MMDALFEDALPVPSAAVLVAVAEEDVAEGLLDAAAEGDAAEGLLAGLDDVACPPAQPASPATARMAQTVAEMVADDLFMSVSFRLSRVFAHSTGSSPGAGEGDASFAGGDAGCSGEAGGSSPCEPLEGGSFFIPDTATIPIPAAMNTSQAGEPGIAYVTMKKTSSAAIAMIAMI